MEKVNATWKNLEESSIELKTNCGIEQIKASYVVLLIIQARDKPIFKKIQIIDGQQVEVLTGR